MAGENLDLLPRQRQQQIFAETVVDNRPHRRPGFGRAYPHAVSPAYLRQVCAQAVAQKDQSGGVGGVGLKDSPALHEGQGMIGDERDLNTAAAEPLGRPLDDALQLFKCDEHAFEWLQQGLRFDVGRRQGRQGRWQGATAAQIDGERLKRARRGQLRLFVVFGHFGGTHEDAFALMHLGAEEV